VVVYLKVLLPFSYSVNIVVLDLEDKYFCLCVTVVNVLFWLTYGT
jgi:hypothetical protein